MRILPVFVVSVMLLAYGCSSNCSKPLCKMGSKRPPASPAPLNMKKAQEEVNKHYSKAAPEVQEYILWTARAFGRSGRWLNEDAFASLSKEQREKKIKYLAVLLNNSEYGRHLCMKLAEASAIKDKSLVPGLIKVAGYSNSIMTAVRNGWLSRHCRGRNPTTPFLCS